MTPMNNNKLFIIIYLFPMITMELKFQKLNFHDSRCVLPKLKLKIIFDDEFSTKNSKKCSTLLVVSCPTFTV